MLLQYFVTDIMQWNNIDTALYEELNVHANNMSSDIKLFLQYR